MEVVKEPPKSLDTARQKEMYQKLQNHLQVIFEAPCSKFPGYPFDWDEEEDGVSITAIIEHFDDEQQDALIKKFNEMLKQSHNYCGHTGYILRSLKASKLQRAEGGIQFEAKTTTTPEYLMEAMKISECASLWEHTKTYPDFINLCQIRYNIKAFGCTFANVVRFKARTGVPIFIMMWLLRQLDYCKASESCGFGQVIITQRNGLPANGDDHSLHYSSGLIKWN